MLEARYERPAGRGGPGAGRPAKLYARSGVTAAVSVPARAYDVAAELLARAVEAEPTGAARESLMAVARQVGESLRDELPAKAIRPDDRSGVRRPSRLLLGWEPRPAATAARRGRERLAATGGFGDDPGCRARLGMPGAGPVLVVTDVGELRPDAHSCMLVFTAVHPGVTADDVRARTGWDLAVTRDLEVTEPPSPEEIAALRGLEATRGLHG